MKMKLYVFRKWSSLSDAEKLLKLNQGALWTDVNVLINSVLVVIIIWFFLR